MKSKFESSLLKRINEKLSAPEDWEYTELYNAIKKSYGSVAKITKHIGKIYVMFNIGKFSTKDIGKIENTIEKNFKSNRDISFDFTRDTNNNISTLYVGLHMTTKDKK